MIAAPAALMSTCLSSTRIAKVCSHSISRTKNSFRDHSAAHVVVKERRSMTAWPGTRGVGLCIKVNCLGL